LLVEDVEQAASQAIDLELRATDATAANVEWMLLLMLLTQLLDEFLGRAMQQMSSSSGEHCRRQLDKLTNAHSP